MIYQPKNQLEQEFFLFLFEQAGLFTKCWTVDKYEASISSSYGTWKSDGKFTATLSLRLDDEHFQFETMLTDIIDIPITIWVDYEEYRSSQFQIWWKIAPCPYTVNSEQSNYWPYWPVISIPWSVEEN